MTCLQPQWHPSWEPVFHTVSPQLQKIDAFLAKQRRTARIFPPPPAVFRAFQLTPLHQLKAVIIGQDPYHTPGAAQGLAFSVPDHEKRPPSLRNIFREYARDLARPLPQTNDLSPWAREGVLLINRVLTVEESTPGAHRRKGWEEITTTVIRQISRRCSNVVFVLWGRDAQQLRSGVDETKHAVLTASHPSPFSARHSFFGSAPFSTINRILTERGVSPIDWTLT
ncbi:MAG: uracil-DNA glycosylase [Fibrobacterota bacterium]